MPPLVLPPGILSPVAQPSGVQPSGVQPSGVLSPVVLAPIVLAPIVLAPIVLAIEHSGAHTAIVRLALPADHDAFAGHFPGRPILPGIVQLDWAVQLAATCFGYRFRPARRVRVKFMRVIGPNPSGLSVALHDDPARAEVAFEYRIGDTVASKGSACLDP